VSWFPSDSIKEKERKIIYFLNTAHNSEKNYKLTLYTIYEDKQTVSSICPKGKRAG
jgi:hypothetical protein